MDQVVRFAIMGLCCLDYTDLGNILILKLAEAFSIAFGFMGMQNWPTLAACALDAVSKWHPPRR